MSEQQPEAPALAMPAGEPWTPEEIAEFKARLEVAMANPGRLRVLPSDHWKDRAEAAEAKLAEIEVDMRIGAEVAAAERDRLRTHEHEWTRCPECKQPGQPCPCPGVPCCEMERREIAAANEAARDVRARAEAEVAAHREYDTYRRALWVMVRQFGGSVFLTSGQMEDVPLLASLGIGRAPGGIRINAEEEPRDG